MTSTIVGRALAADGVCRWFDGTGEMSTLLLDTRELQRIQPRGYVDVEHDGRQIGEIIHLSRDSYGNLDLVAVVDQPPPEEGHYLSVEALHDNGMDIEIRAVALTASPASLGNKEICVLWGVDARRPVSGLPLGIPDRVRSLVAEAHREYRRRLPHLELGRAGGGNPPSERRERIITEIPSRSEMGPLERGPLGHILSVN